MTEHTIVANIVLVAGVGVATALILTLLRLPVVAGLLAAGALIGPHGLNLMGGPESMNALAEAGVVLLLFTIGLEFSLARLRGIAQFVAVGGGLQVALTTAGTAAAAMYYGFPGNEGVFFGFLAALSSTAIVLRALTERNETAAPHGRFIIGAMIFQDLCVVPMILLVPVLAGRGGDNFAAAMAIALGKAAAAVAATLLIARVVVPRFFAWVDKTQSREVFLLAVVTICAGVAWLTAEAGLSLALGAFLAGVVIADSEFAHRAMTEMLPLRDFFTSIFFVAMGMMFDHRIIPQFPGAVIGLFFALLIGKGVIAAAAAGAMRFPLRAAVMAGLGMAQFGEFGFVLAQLGIQHQLIDPLTLRIIMAPALLTMFVTPIVIRFAPHIAASAERVRFLTRLMGARDITESQTGNLPQAGHVVVVGLGVSGRVLVQALKHTQATFLAIDINAQRVRDLRDEGEPAFYGDITSQETLAAARIRLAKALVLLINDPTAARRAIRAVRLYAPEIPVFVRTRYQVEAPELLALGATQVVAEEVEAAMEMLAWVLQSLGVPRNVIGEEVSAARNITAASVRSITMPRVRVGVLPELDEMKVEKYLVRPGSYAAGKSAIEMNMRKSTGALMVALQRGNQLLEYPNPAGVFEAGDVVYLVGSRGALSRVFGLLDSGDVAGQPTMGSLPAFKL